MRGRERGGRREGREVHTYIVVWRVEVVDNFLSLLHCEVPVQTNKVVLRPIAHVLEYVQGLFKNK